jgi:predicted nucleic acid-binding protein
VYGKIKNLFEKQTGIGEKEIKRHTVDFMLASTALELDATIVSEDGIIQKIKVSFPNLKVENWKIPL